MGGNLSKSFESCYLHTILEVFYSLGFFIIRVAISCLLLISHAEQRSLQDIDMTTTDKIRIVLHEERKYKHTDMHSVIIGIGSHDNVVVSEVLEIFFYTEGRNEKIKFLIFGHATAAFLVTVDRLTT